jgi:hypothetical protein
MAFCKLMLLLAVCFAQQQSTVKVLGVIKQLQAGPTRFELTESEVNQHIVQSLKTSPRPGLDSLMVKFFDGNYVSTYTTVDFDAVEKWKPGTIPMMLRPVLNGKRAIWVDIRFFVNNAHATFKVEKAYYEKIPIPSFVVEKAIQVIAARQPEKYDTTKPIPLPFGMRTLWTRAQRVAGEK